MAKSEKKHNKELDEALESFQHYNEEQRFWYNVKENATATIKQFEDAIKLQKEVIILAENKIESEAVH